MNRLLLRLMKMYFWCLVIIFLVLLFFWQRLSRRQPKEQQLSHNLPSPPPKAVKVGALPPFLEGESCFLFVLILSHAKGRFNRDAVRQTWLTSRPQNLIYKFFLGNIALESEDVKKEDQQFRDMVFLDVGDDYHSLSSKVRDGISWASSSY